MSTGININNVVKRYDNTTIIPGLSVQIVNGEFFTLLGPSGCGKTTLLRMIAGFNTIEDGTICFDSQIINDIPAHKRNIGMVFQNYAIFPHMTVRENVEYGLKLRKIPKQEIKTKVDQMLKTVRIDEYSDRLPERLSGGQQQRVALARAIVIHPSVLLMDEPLSNLDAKLRIEMRSAIRDIQKKVGITTVYVTHDQEEALAISDRIAVMKDGVIQQLGRPENIYTRPANVFVATFIGHSNLLKGKIRMMDTKREIVINDGTAFVMENLVDTVKDGQEVIIAVRPEELVISDAGIKTSIKTRTFLGKYVNYEVTFDEKLLMDPLLSTELSQDIGSLERLYEEGEPILLKPIPGKINVFTIDGETSLIKDVRKYE